MSQNMPPWWPDGCDEALVRECPCDRCRALIDAIEQERQGVAIDGQHASLAAYAGGVEA